jgi:hypothetical protein
MNLLSLGYENQAPLSKAPDKMEVQDEKVQRPNKTYQ